MSGSLNMSTPTYKAVVGCTKFIKAHTHICTHTTTYTHIHACGVCACVCACVCVCVCVCVCGGHIICGIYIYICVCAGRATQDILTDTPPPHHINNTHKYTHAQMYTTQAHASTHTHSTHTHTHTQTHILYRNCIKVKLEAKIRVCLSEHKHS